MTGTIFKPGHELSERQRRILDYVTLVITRDDRAPTLREIMDDCRISSSSVAAYNLDILAKRGYLVCGDYGEARRYRLPENPWRQLVEDAAVIFDKLAGINEFGEIADWRERRAKLIRG